MFLLPPLGFLLGRTRPLPDVLDPARVRIRCPQCGWQPTRKDTWICSPGCGHRWNTFETHGVCPACAQEWAQTACHKCGVWSAHEAWYERA